MSNGRTPTGRTGAEAAGVEVAAPSHCHLRGARPPPYLARMATQNSFDITTGVDLQEVDNAVNQANREIAQRYDFKGVNVSVEFDRAAGVIRLEAEDEYRMKAVVDVLQSALVRRGVPLKNAPLGELDSAALGRVRQEITLAQGIPTDTAREIAKAVKAQGFKKVQVAIQGDQLRVSSPSRDALQEVIAFLKGQDFGVELQFGNFR
jgi:cyclic-di-GMP-binding protein